MLGILATKHDKASKNNKIEDYVKTERQKQKAENFLRLNKELRYLDYWLKKTTEKVHKYER